MSLPRNGPRQKRKPSDEVEVEAEARSLRPGAGAGMVEVAGGCDDGPGLRPGWAVPCAPPPERPGDPARGALLDVLAVRGRPIRRERGGKPSAAFRRAAERYIVDHHYGYCVQFARSKSARHVPVDDLLQACLLGAYNALERFEADHPSAFRFLSYAKWWLLCECNRLLHRDECLVVVPEEVKKARNALARACREDVPDEDAAVLLGVELTDVRAARDAHLGHDHRRVDERSRAVRGGLEHLRAARDERVAALREAAGLAEALAGLDPLLRAVLHDEYGVGDPEPGSPRPTTDQSRRALRHLALRRLRERLSG